MYIWYILAHMVIFHTISLLKLILNIQLSKLISKVLIKNKTKINIAQHFFFFQAFQDAFKDICH